jgi:hypothetical protein
VSETGATEQQIEAAYARVPGIDAMRANDRTLRKSQIRFGARYLVPPGSAIVSDAELAAVRRVAAALKEIIASEPMSSEGRAIGHGVWGDIETAKAIGGNG